MTNQKNFSSWDRFLREGLLDHPGWIRNAALPRELITVGGQQMPVTLNAAGCVDTSWVASLANAYGPYARAELTLVNTPLWQRPLLAAASYSAQMLMQAGALTGGAFLNNWFLATNLHPRSLTAEQVLAACEQLARAHPRLPGILRSLTPPLHSALLADLVKAGFLLIPTRQVWLTPNLADGAWRGHSDVRKDLKLEARSAGDYQWVPGAAFRDPDYLQAIALYDDLYRGKYPRFNPDYTTEFLRLGVETGWLRLQGLRDLRTGALVGMVGVIEREGVFATPVLGYDRSAPAREGLYRKLMLQAFLLTEANKGLLHCSAGAGSFKQQRGANYHVEFAAVWAQHLPAWRQKALRALHAIVQRVAVPYLQSRAL